MPCADPAGGDHQRLGIVRGARPSAGGQSVRRQLRMTWRVTEQDGLMTTRSAQRGARPGTRCRNDPAPSPTIAVRGVERLLQTDRSCVERAGTWCRRRRRRSTGTPRRARVRRLNPRERASRRCAARWPTRTDLARRVKTARKNSTCASGSATNRRGVTELYPAGRSTTTTWCHLAPVGRLESNHDTTSSWRSRCRSGAAVLM